MARLTCIGLVAGLLRTGAEDAEEAVVGAGILPVCLDLVLQYPLHSILHHQVIAQLKPRFRPWTVGPDRGLCTPACPLLGVLSRLSV